MARGRRAGQVRPALPVRRCLSCKARKPQAELLRLAVVAGAVVPDPLRRLPGRGCSICLDPTCARAAVKGRQISRALKGKAADPAIDRLLGWMSPGSVA